MAKKIYLIPIEVEEEAATPFINLICLAENFNPSSTELTEEELEQEKLNFTGLIAGKGLRKIAEEKLEEIKITEAIALIRAEIASKGDAFTVKPVMVQDGSN